MISCLIAFIYNVILRCVTSYEIYETRKINDISNYTYSIISNFPHCFKFQVRELVSECQCPTQFPMIRVSEGKYRIGDTQVLIFVRVRTYCKNSILQ